MGRTDKYYIGRIKCETNNAMMKEIAELVGNYEFSLLHTQPLDFCRKIKDEIAAICAKHKRCIPIEVQLLESPTGCGFTVYARKPGSDHSILCVTAHEVTKEINI